MGHKTNVGGGFATYRSLGGTNQPMCLAASSGNTRPFAAICNPSSLSQQWTRGFVNDGRIDNRSTFTALTRQPTASLEVRFLGGGQVGQNWHEHIIACRRAATVRRRRAVANAASFVGFSRSAQCSMSRRVSTASHCSASSSTS